jgi:hypothetical protein
MHSLSEAPNIGLNNARDRRMKRRGADAVRLVIQ